MKDQRGFRPAAGVLAVCLGVAAFVLLPLSAGAAVEPAILLDGAAVSEEAAVSMGLHTITAQAEEGVNACLAVYENGRFQASSLSRTLEYDFPAQGAEIRLYCLDSHFRPLRPPIRAAQGAAAATLVYSGEARCSPPSEDPYAFTAYLVRLEVVKRGGQITEIRNIAGYQETGGATGSTNARILARAAAKMPERIIQKQSTEGIDAVTNATCSSRAILAAVEAALQSTPWTEEGGDPSGGGETVPDGVYAGSAQCLSGNLNYLVDVEVSVQGGAVTAVTDRTLQTPLSAKDRELYGQAWAGLSAAVAASHPAVDSLASVDAVTGATVSSMGILSAMEDALAVQRPPDAPRGRVYAPEGISLYARVYPIVTVEGGRITAVRLSPVEGTDTELLSAFVDGIVRGQSVRGLSWPDAVADDAFAVANLMDQILYGEGILS